MKHENNGRCSKCHEIINLYPNFEPKFLSWFEFLQLHHPEAHVSCAGRGKQAQEDKYNHGLSRAQWGMSSHNYNCALDFFVIMPGLEIYDKHWFETVLEPNLADYLIWYGKPGSVFYELPHVELKAWRDMKAQGLIQLVETVSYKEDYD